MQKERRGRVEGTPDRAGAGGSCPPVDVVLPALVAFGDFAGSDTLGSSIDTRGAVVRKSGEATNQSSVTYA